MNWDWKQNFVRPGSAIGGRIVLWLMNRGHASIQDFARSCFKMPDRGRVLDIGCGGGAFIATMRRDAPEVKVYGIDYSSLAVQRARALNHIDVKNGLVEIVEASVDKLPFPDDYFELVTACETIYFWPDPVAGCREAWRVTRPGGQFAICVDSSDRERAKKFTDRIKGMTVYPAEEIRGFLETAGFASVECRRDDKNSEILCVVAQKAQ